MSSVYLNNVMNSIVKGSVSPQDIKLFLDSVLDLVCEVGFSDYVRLLFNSIRKFEDRIFRYDETFNHVVKDLVY